MSRLRDVWSSAILSCRLFHIVCIRAYSVAGDSRNVADELLEILERSNTAYSAYKAGIIPEKREMLDSVTSNRVLNGKLLEITPSSPFDLIATRSQIADGSPRRDIHRTWGRLLPLMLSLLQRKQESQENIAD